MQFQRIALSLAAALIVFPAVAQDDQAAPATDTPAADAAPTTDAETAAAPAGPQPGQPYVVEEHGAWALRCVAVEEGKEPCQIYQVLTDRNGGPVAEMVVFPLPADQPMAAAVVVTTPLETLLTEGVTVAVDSTDGKRYPFTYCTAQGCASRFGLTADEVGAMQRGNTARVRIVPLVAPDQQVILEASLSGFTAGYDALSARVAN